MNHEYNNSTMNKCYNKREHCKVNYKETKIFQILFTKAQSTNVNESKLSYDEQISWEFSQRDPGKKDEEREFLYIYIYIYIYLEICCLTVLSISKNATLFSEGHV